METRIRLHPVLVVEGKYDKIRLSSLLDAVIVETDGFGIFKNPEKLNLIRRAAEQRGVVILTDSDQAGFKIRSYLAGSLPRHQVRHAYIPDVLGVERRKDAPSKEGKLGVEGMDTEALLEALRRSGALDPVWEPPDVPAITRADFYQLGLSGGANSSVKRRQLAKRLGLPARISTGGLLQAVNLFLSREDFLKLAACPDDSK